MKYVGIVRAYVFEVFKRRAVFGVQINGFRLLVMQNSYATKELKNNVVLSLKHIVCIAMWSLVMYSNYFEIYIMP